MVRAFLGMGLLGTAFVTAMRQRGEAVRVWSRTAAKAQALADAGAEVAPSLAAAVGGADVIHLALRDDAAVDAVLARVQRHLKRGAAILDHTTTSVNGAVRRTEEWAKSGLRYIHAPVLMQPQDALRAAGVMLVSGDQTLIESVLPELEPMTGKVLYLGGDVGTAAAMALIADLYLISVVAGLSDVLKVAKGTGVPMELVQGVLGAMDLTALATNSLNWIQSGPLQAQATRTLGMARKDVRLMLKEGAKSGGRMVVMPAVAGEMDRWMRSGFGQVDWAIFASAATDAS